MRKTIFAVAVLAIIPLVACASSENRAKLAMYESNCARGDKPSCDLLPYKRSINQDEAVKNGFVGAAVVVLLPIIALGAVAEARQDAGICGWGKHTYAC
jgi:hypothetical protein